MKTQSRFFITFSVVAFFLFSIQAFANFPLSYIVVKNPYRFSVYFEFAGKEQSEGRVIKNCFHIRTTYDLYDAFGDYEAQGICRALSLGAIYTWAKKIDVYDSLGNKIGLIAGDVISTAKAQFSIYDASDSLIGTAYLDYDSSSFTLFDPFEGTKTIGILKRNFVENATDEWKVVLYDSENFDCRLFKIFSAFVVDNEDYFKKDA